MSEDRCFTPSQLLIMYPEAPDTWTEEVLEGYAREGILDYCLSAYHGGVLIRLDSFLELLAWYQEIEAERGEE